MIQVSFPARGCRHLRLSKALFVQTTEDRNPREGIAVQSK